jgi:hypothetical protein
MCLAVSCAAFLAAVLTATLNVFLPGLFAACGMLVVSLLYLGLAYAYRDEFGLRTTGLGNRSPAVLAKSAARRFWVDDDGDGDHSSEPAKTIADPDEEMLLSWLAVQRGFFGAALQETLPDDSLSDNAFALRPVHVTVIWAGAKTGQQLGTEKLKAEDATPSCDQGGQA